MSKISSQATVATNTGLPANNATDIRQKKIWITLVISLFGLLYLSSINRIFGLLLDDAWYLLLGKALATGQGYQLVNSPSPGILPLYPPGWPFVLSLGYRLVPNFPNNIIWLKLINVAAVFGCGCLTYLFFTRCRNWRWPLALMFAALIGFQSEYFSMATTTFLSECAFTFWLLLLVYFVERADQRFAANNSRAWLYLIAAALAGSACLLTRTMGIAVLAGIFFWWVYQKHWHKALLFTAIVAATSLPWIIYARNHAPTLAQKEEQRGNIVMNYAEAFWQKMAGTDQKGVITAADLPARVAGNFYSIATSSSPL